MIPAAIYGAAAAAVISCAAYTASCLPEHALRGAVLRARWAWRCRGHPPVPHDGELPEGDMAGFDAIVQGWNRTAPAERSRT